MESPKVEDTKRDEDDDFNLLLKQQAETERLFGCENPKKLLWGLTWPTMIAYFADAVYTIADTVMVGQKSPYIASAVNYATPLSIYINEAIAMLISLGVNGHIANLIGQRKFKEAEKSFAAAVQLCFIFGFIYPLIILLSIGKLLPIMGTPEPLVPMAKRYAYIAIGAGSICVNLQLTFSNVLAAQGKSLIAGIGLICGTFCNITIDACVIYAANDGILGSAISLACGNAVVVLVCAPFLLFHLKKSPPIRLHWCLLLKPQPAMLKILSYGIGGFFYSFSLAVSLSCYNTLITKTSKNFDQAAAISGCLGATNVLLWLFFYLSLAVNTAFLSSASYSHGAHLPGRYYQLLKYTIIWESIIMLSAGVLLTAFAKWLPYIFFAEHDAVSGYYRETMTQVLYRVAPTQCIVAVTIFAFGAFQTVEANVLTAVVACMRQLLILVPLSYIIGYTTFDTWKLLLAYPGSDMISSLLAWILLLAYRKKVYFTKKDRDGQVYNTEPVIVDHVHVDILSREVTESST